MVLDIDLVQWNCTGALKIPLIWRWFARLGIIGQLLRSRDKLWITHNPEVGLHAAKPASAMAKLAGVSWPQDLPHPSRLLTRPELVDAIAEIPDAFSGMQKMPKEIGLPVTFKLDACRHGGITELEEAELTEGLGAHRKPPVTATLRRQ
ncbi:hypothetical protein ACVIJ6_007539 [Bradyrhizobium sp. USDA 4369]